ncbi:hypothetical protein B0T25DRAFT_165021 [Lasiosphaeria hispida]|uniref:Uncharacterized protein n=1 Tax=Lasiosphaeria hispida TaxID=260671 RepID=A0AAJ0HMK4_9PEZI|nr:hypothetical protein B0T25DRAFT_165021 [Lasiosphaeria hispida]
MYRQQKLELALLTAQNGTANLPVRDSPVCMKVPSIQELKIGQNLALSDAIEVQPCSPINAGKTAFSLPLHLVTSGLINMSLDCVGSRTQAARQGRGVMGRIANIRLAEWESAPESLAGARNVLISRCHERPRWMQVGVGVRGKVSNQHHIKSARPPRTASLVFPAKSKVGESGVRETASRVTPPDVWHSLFQEGQAQPLLLVLPTFPPLDPRLGSLRFTICIPFAHIWGEGLRLQAQPPDHDAQNMRESQRNLTLSN